MGDARIYWIFTLSDLDEVKKNEEKEWEDQEGEATGRRMRIQKEYYEEEG